MPQEEFITFQRFNVPEDAEYLVALLQQNGIEVIAEDTTPTVDLTLNNSDSRKSLDVMVRQRDFPAANKILENNAEELLQFENPSHPLHQFSQEELIEVVRNADQWGKFDYLLALKLLEDQGVQYSEEELEEIRQKRLEELRKPIRGGTVWLILGIGLAFLGGFLGMAIGFGFYTARKTLPNGERVPTYDKKTRNLAQLMIIIGIVGLLFGMFSMLMERA